MFSFSQFFLIIFIALLVLDPRSLRNLLYRAGVLLRKREQLVTQLREQWLLLRKEQRLQENNKRAEIVDGLYKKK
ncbi:MAG: hypothetical protein V4471_03010 [Pseudomonadota bacterium]